jgi:hypothetical protein
VRLLARRIRIEAFTAGGCRQPVLLDPDQERAEHHLPSRHLEDDGVEPLDEQVFERRRLTRDIN